MTRTKQVQIIWVVACGAVFFWTVLGNLRYPLLWNDEGETAEFGRRILLYGYPKADDGKNLLNLMEHKNPEVGVNKRLGAYVGQGWVQYYIAALGGWFAHMSHDLYTKTLLLRIPFAILGIFGVCLIGWSLLVLIPNKMRLWGFSVFLLLESLTVSIGLHLREVRYYSLVMFLAGAWLWINVRYFIRKDLGYKAYLILSSLSLVVLFNTQYMVYFALSGGWFLYYIVFEKWQKQKFFKDTAPIILSGLLALPLVFFYQIPQMMSNNILQSGFSFVRFVGSIKRVVVFALRYGFGLLPVVLIICFRYLRKDYRFSIIGLGRIERGLIFATILIFTYTILIARIPEEYLFERYFLVLQPIGVATTILGWYLLRTHYRKKIIDVCMISAIVISLFLMNHDIRGRFYELSHPYKGPIDYIISYINQKYSDTGNLVIATNYEDPVYMYYLQSKIILGYSEKELEEDLKVEPDIIVPRKPWKSKKSWVLMQEMNKSGSYTRKTFPIVDYPFNNIPELYMYSRHLFATPVTNREGESIEIFEKNN